MTARKVKRIVKNATLYSLTALALVIAMAGAVYIIYLRTIWAVLMFLGGIAWVTLFLEVNSEYFDREVAE